MKTNTKIILASSLLVALFAGQSAIASQATEVNYFAKVTASEKTEAPKDIVRYSITAPEEAHEKVDSYNIFPEGQSQ